MTTPSASSVHSPRYWGIVPAAGIGSRMGADRPKQYLMIGTKTLLEHTLERLLQFPQLAGLVVALHPEDYYWEQLEVSNDPRISVVDGGEDRSRSVLNALNFLTLEASAGDWALVHDAARPCVTGLSIDNLRRHTAEHQVGGILGVPVGDTLKAVDSQLAIERTQDRKGLWQAQTPQLFRYQLLHQCLTRALAQGETITDEASALELAGYRPLVVEGRTDNIKVTRPEDLELAAMILKQQELSL
ncbi:2-C-methyl-D-erythritol 4-phosphate cytidylyltransferase [Marinimicrobium sp. ABcell2]|uniref:2-C-methyl-D-erythritol 4-phosphate cytidylyltransferase n=1 Tax=Marinimicrobium sp. ABcell2 TaxID=3069751 RepID=UPI0027B71879|nr:2-C-methyl-D-erythritol 4-phosphate cytidylyltransferase [Marinimicrobium sp. ABcell2]MDQ2075405.1 2-C-methyl-D-erythritol 4-phosphate cytidylyltransferase [Marinimicrobium sp. ABcell2]